MAKAKKVKDEVKEEEVKEVVAPVEAKEVEVPASVEVPGKFYARSVKGGAVLINRVGIVVSKVMSQDKAEVMARRMNR